MAYVSVPKDLNAVKTKVLLNLTKRQLICFGGGAYRCAAVFYTQKSYRNERRGTVHDDRHAARVPARYV